MNIAGLGEFELDVSEFIVSTVRTGGSITLLVDSAVNTPVQVLHYSD